MGNIHSGVSNHVERFPLGNSSDIVVRKTNSFKGRQVVDTWTAEYSVGNTSCELGLTKTKRNKRVDDELFISLHDYTPQCDVDFQMNVSVEEDLLLSDLTLNGPLCMEQLPEYKAPIAQGGVIKSSSFLYGHHDHNERKGLIVILREKRIDDDEELPYMITVKHYFAAGRSSDADVGVSFVAKIQSDTSQGLSLQIEKPVTQHQRYLLSMFDNVKATGWRPNTSSGNSLNPPNADPVSYYRIRGQQNVSTSFISNGGYTLGNYNGAMIFQNSQIWFGSCDRRN